MVEIKPGSFTRHHVNGSRREFACARDSKPVALSGRPIAEPDRCGEIYGHAKPIEQCFNRSFKARIAD